MKRIKKRKYKYKYRKRIRLPSSKRYAYGAPVKHGPIIALLVIILLIVIFLGITNKSKRQVKASAPASDIQQLTYTPSQEKIAAFEIPVEVSHKIFQGAKNNNKKVASLFASYITQKEKGKNDEQILKNIFRYRPGILASKKTKSMYKEATACYEQFILDLEVFPIPSEYEYTFENSWYAERTYGGNRRHYGVDIMDPKNEKGVIPIVSMSLGTVENIGWNNMGGYRVGVRTKKGAYIYYAHLNKYAPNLKKGAKLEAGDLIGYMGDSGYGEEGTSGEFPVHLHIGIATKALGSAEAWINPYYILKYLEDKEMSILKSSDIF